VARAAKEALKPAPGTIDRRLREAAILLLLPFVAYLFLALWTYTPTDPGWSHAGDAGAVRNIGGVVGAWASDIALYFAGVSAYLLPLMLLVAGWRAARGAAAAPSTIDAPLRLIGCALLVA
jgi:DNA segregation ATPase FtsK/SpoIIIE, S-DNA-T family